MSFVVHRVAKSAARYTDAGGREKCGYCRFFVAPRACGKVIGPVSPQGWCKYFSRQMVSQFGGSTVTSGIPAGATLALDFMSSGNMPAGVTFSRASTATYTDASGVIQSAAVNQPRWDYAGGSLRGLLIEEARTNIAAFSEDFSNAIWLKSSGGSSSPPVVIANQVVAPDGTSTADRIVYPAVSGAGSNSVVGQAIGASAAPYTYSVWLRGNVGGERLYIDTTPDGALYYRAQVILTTAWQRFSMTTAALSATTWYFQLGCDLRDASETATLAQTIYAWGAQIEQGANATSYIATAGASVTRAMDVCQMPVGAWFNPAAYSLLFVFDVPVVNKVVGGISDASFGANTSFFSDSQYICGATLAGVPSLVAGATCKQCAAVAGGGLIRLSNNGALPTTIAGAATQSGATRLAIGNDPWSLSTACNGHIQAVGAWPRVLSDAELRQVTT